VLLAALSTGHKLGLGLVGLAFVVFALISAVVIPHRNPNFPGRFLGLYITIAVLFFVAMLSAVLRSDRAVKLLEESTPERCAECGKTELIQEADVLGITIPAGGSVTYTVNGKQYVSVAVGGQSHNDVSRPAGLTNPLRLRDDAIYTFVLP